MLPDVDFIYVVCIVSVADEQLILISRTCSFSFLNSRIFSSIKVYLVVYLTRAVVEFLRIP